MTFLVILTAGPRTEAVQTVLELAAAASELGHHLEVFLSGDGVTHAGQLGGRVAGTLCDADLRWRQSQPVDMPGVVRGSLADLARSVRAADRVLTFT